MTTHFYTVDGNERQNAIQNLGFRDEGIQCYVVQSPPAGQAPFYRAYHTQTGGHFYTMSIEEVDRATNGNDWVAEGIACYIYPQQLGGTVPLYRAYLRQSNDHFYTTSKPEHDIAVNGGCSDEGIAGYVFPSQAGGTVPLYRLYGPHAPVPLGPMQADTGDEHVGTGEWMHSGASMSSTGLISGHTRIWCTILLKGFHGSVFPVLLDGDQKVIWPPNPEVAKHQYGVDGVWIGTHDRTEYWANQADASVIGEAKSLALIQFYDPKKMLLADLDIVGKAITVIVSAIKAL